MELSQPDQILKVLEEAASLNRQDSFREGHLLKFPNYGQVIMTGDIHGYGANFQRLRQYADLDRQIHRHVIIHEIIHTNGTNGQPAAPDKPTDEDASSLILFQAAQWKVDYPDQVHFLLGNHDLAQITNREISKGGIPSIAQFNQWITDRFGQDPGEKILRRIDDFLGSVPLAAKCANRIWLSHSLPGPVGMNFFDFSIFHREWTADDLVPKGSVYELVWGRAHQLNQLQELGEFLDVDHFIVGHQGQEQGFDTVDERVIILASDHAMGCFLPIDLNKKYTFRELVERVKFFCDLPE